MGPAKTEPEEEEEADLAPRGRRGQEGTHPAAASAPMAASAELSQDAVLKFLAERGGRARNADLLEHFRGVLHSPEPQRRAQARQRFKELVNAVATVRQEPGAGAKYVQLRKKYRAGAGAGAGAEAEAGAGRGGRTKTAEAAPPRAPADASVAVEEAPRLPPEAPGGGDGSSGGSSSRRNSGGADAASAAAERLAEQDSSETAKASDAVSSAPSPEEGAPSAPSQRRRRRRRQPPEIRAGGQEDLEVAEEEEEEESGFPCATGPLVSEVEAAAEAEAGEAAVGAEEDGAPYSPPSASPATALGALPAAAAANTPRCGRKNFRERMLGSSPQMKRGGGGDSDSASLASSSAEDESGSGSGSVALDPLEHAWMLCASDGRWESLEGLLGCEPALLSKRDFITGFSCLHWAAKHGRHELLALLVSFARRHRLPVDINARTSGGYTALHLAAMHGHLEVVKLLVGAYDADVEIRDYSGRKAAHYLSRSTAEEVRSLVGALQDEADSGAPNGGGRWRLSRVLPANLIAYKLSHLHHGGGGGGEEGEAGEGAGVFGKGKELSRKTSGSGRLKPRLNKIRFRTQIIHTTPSFRGDAEEEGQEERTLKGSFKLRPKSNVFG